MKLRMAAKVLVGPLMLSGFVGCAAKIPEEKEGILAIDAPRKYKSRGEKITTTDDDWVNQLSKDRTLKKLIDEVKANNWDIKKAAVRVETAGANAKIAGSKRFPQFGLNLDGARSQQAFIGFPIGGGAMDDGSASSSMDSADSSGVATSLSNNFGLSLDTSWEIDLWGRIRTGQEAAIAEVQASKQDLRGLGSSLAAQTAKIWFALLEAGDQIKLAEDSVKSFEQTERTLRDRFETGNGSAAQLRVATADVQTAKALLEETKGQQRAARRQLEVLLGRYPGAEIKAAGGMPEVPKAPPAGVPSGLLKRRSDIMAAERRLASADRRIKEAQLATLPQISLTGSGGTASEMLRDVVNPDFSVWRIAGNIGQPVFAGGEILGNLKLREIAAKEAYIDYQRTAIGAFQEVETRLDNEVILRKREESLRAAQKNLIAAYERALEEYRTGVGDSTILLTTQRQMLSVRGQVLTLRRLRLDNRIDLHLALGGSIEKKA